MFDQLLEQLRKPEVIAALAAGCATLYVAAWLFPKPAKFEVKAKKKLRTKDWKKDVVYLYQFPKTTKLTANLSPFCLKMETWLRMAGIQYEDKSSFGECFSKWLFHGGTIPFIELNGVEYNDSGLIIPFLSDHFKIDIEKDLTDEQKGIGKAVELMVENHYFQCKIFVRYFEHWDDYMKSELWGVSNLTLSLAKRKALQFLHKKLVYGGLGKHSRDEMIHLALEATRSLSEVLGDKPFIFGDRPHKVDATVFGMVAQTAALPVDSPIKLLLDGECSNLTDYCERIKSQFWPDWGTWQTMSLPI